MTAHRVAGVDGCRGAWVMAVLVPGGPPAVRWCEDFTDVVDHARSLELEVVGVDMPIGLPVDAPRPSDAAARRLLGPRRASMFPTPVRAVLGATGYRDALQRSRAAAGRGLSKQAWYLVPAIAQVRAAVTAARPGAPAVIEVHPETSFAVMAPAPLAAKRTPEGAAARRTLLAGAVQGLDPASLEDPVAMVDRAGAPPSVKIAPDDVIDALAAAWSAARCAAGAALILGEGTDPDGFALTVVV